MNRQAPNSLHEVSNATGMLAKLTAVKGWETTRTVTTRTVKGWEITSEAIPAQGTAPCQPYAPGAQEAQHRIDAAPPDTASAAKPAAVERWSQQEAEVVNDDDDPAELMERARQHFKRNILADARDDALEQNLSGSCGSPIASESAAMTGGTPRARSMLLKVSHRRLRDG
jgi:hypothetical protein